MDQKPDQNEPSWIDRPIRLFAGAVLAGGLFVATVAFLQQHYILGLARISAVNLAAPFLVGAGLSTLIAYFFRKSRRRLLERVDEGTRSLKAEKGEREKAEDSLRHQLILLETQQETSPDGILIVDQHRRALSWNQLFLTMWGIDEAALANGDMDAVQKKVASLLVDPEGFQRRITDLYENLDMAEQAPGEEILLNDGRVFERHSRGLKDENGTYLGRVWFYRDVTERRRLDAMKTEFISLVSHELRTPLTSIHGAIRLLLSDKFTAGLEEKGLDLLTISGRNCERLLSLVDDLLDAQKILTGNMTYDLEATDLTQLMEEAVENNQSFADGFKVSMDCRHPDGEVMVNGDNRRLMQVLTNLLSNAIKYSPQGDRVALTVEKRDGWARVSVADNGPGVPEDFRGKLFGRFAQAENLDTRERGGSGLGLSISKAIVEQHQGRVGFDTELGKGSTFYFDLPLLEPSYTKER